MSEYQNFTSKSSSRSLYDKYINGGNNHAENTSRFERKKYFCSDLSKYHINKCVIDIGESSKWDNRNCAGVPMDYDIEENVVYVDGSDSHTLLIGSTGSKKSRLVVIPTVRILAASDENMIICDPKGEIHRRTAGFLHENSYKIHTINLREPQKGDGWNMLDIPYEFFCNGNIDKACEFINDMAINLIPIESKDPYWDYSARDMLFGLTLLLFKICKEMELSDDLVNMQNLLLLKEELFFSSESSKIQKTAIWNFAKKDNLIRMRLNGTIISPEKTLSCIISTFDQHMSCFLLQPQIMDMLSKSTFNVHDFGFGKNALFMIMPDEKTTFHKIVTIFLKQIYELLIENAFKKTEENRFNSRINFILDEFSSLPTISDFPQMIAASRSRNIRFTLIIQSKHQLKQRYSEETSTIMSNCANWMFLSSREIDLLREIVELCGTSGVNREPLISISRLQHFNKDKGECLVLNGRKHPYIASLPDIDEYDEAKPSQLENKHRKVIKLHDISHGYFEQVISSKTLDQASNEKNNIVLTIKEPNEIAAETSELQKELEAKFDELFGKLDDEDTQ